MYLTLYGLSKIDRMEMMAVIYATMPLGVILTIGVMTGKDLSIPMWASKFFFRYAGVLVCMILICGYCMTDRYYNFSEGEKKIRIKQKDILTFEKEAENYYIPETG